MCNIQTVISIKAVAIMEKGLETLKIGSFKTVSVYMRRRSRTNMLRVPNKDTLTLIRK